MSQDELSQAVQALDPEPDRLQSTDVRASLLIVGCALGLCAACQNADSDDPIQPSPVQQTDAPNDAAANEDAPVTPACTVTAPTACPNPPVRYADVVPVFKRCADACHDGKVVGGPWPLIDYEHVADWYDAVRDQILTCAMPPADAGITLTDDERMLILNWVVCGVPK
jgi:hypothetical protein